MYSKSNYPKKASKTAKITTTTTKSKTSQLNNTKIPSKVTTYKPKKTETPPKPKVETQPANHNIEIPLSREPLFNVNGIVYKLKLLKDEVSIEVSTETTSFVIEDEKNIDKWSYLSASKFMQFNESQIVGFSNDRDTLIIISPEISKWQILKMYGIKKVVYVQKHQQLFVSGSGVYILRNAQNEWVKLHTISGGSYKYDEGKNEILVSGTREGGSELLNTKVNQGPIYGYRTEYFYDGIKLEEKSKIEGRVGDWCITMFGESENISPSLMEKYKI